MVVGYWDARGFPALISGDSDTQTADVGEAVASAGHYEDYSLPIDSSPNLLPDKSQLGGAHPSDCIADFMNTSWSSRGNYYGWSWYSDVGSSFTQFVSLRSSRYTATSTNYFYSSSAWAAYRSEIDQGRPVVLLVDSNGDGWTDHFVTGVGYDQADTTYGIFNTWDTKIHWFRWRSMASGRQWGIYGFTSFGISTMPPPSPTLVAPADGSGGVELDPTLAWSTTEGASGYDLQIALDERFQSTVIERTGITTSHEDVTGLSPVVTYYWRVRATNEGGASSWSVPWSFTTTSGVITVVCQASSGWNMVALPVRCADTSVTSLFPAASSQAFCFDDQYVACATMTPGVGYWLHFAQAATAAVTGRPITPWSVPVKQGWNMVGAFEQEVAATLVTSTPPGIIQIPSGLSASPFFGYDRGYRPSATLRPGEGYWIKTTQAGTLHFGVGYVKPVAEEENHLNGAVTITVADSAGNRAELYLTQESLSVELVELPPLPPSGVFDARFANNSRYAPQSDQLFELLLNSATHPVSISAHGLNGKKLWLGDGLGGKILDLALEEGRSVSIASRLSRVIVRLGEAKEELPRECVLQQNYPNPFNPSTTIRYALPRESAVRLTVFNTLGQEVAVLVEAEQEAGYHETVFDASGLASGVYLYRLQAGNFIQTKKLALVQ